MLRVLSIPILFNSLQGVFDRCLVIRKFDYPNSPLHQLFPTIRHLLYNILDQRIFKFKLGSPNSFLYQTHADLKSILILPCLLKKKQALSLYNPGSRLYTLTISIRCSLIEFRYLLKYYSNDGYYNIFHVKLLRIENNECKR